MALLLSSSGDSAVFTMTPDKKEEEAVGEEGEGEGDQSSPPASTPSSTPGSTTPQEHVRVSKKEEGVIARATGAPPVKDEVEKCHVEARRLFELGIVADPSHGPIYNAYR